MSLNVSTYDPTTGCTTNSRFEGGRARIGRDADNDLSLPFSFVSSRHALVHVEGEQVVYVDLGSTNGTLYNGKPVAPRRPLTAPDRLVVTIGHIELTLSRAHDARDPRVLDDLVEDQDLARVHAAIAGLRPLHEELQKLGETFCDAREAALSRLPERLRELASAMMRREFPGARS